MSLILRQEHFGGFVYDTNTGLILELNQTAFFIVNLLVQNYTAEKIIKEIRKHFLLKTKNPKNHIQKTKQILKVNIKDFRQAKPARIYFDIWHHPREFLSAPESVALAITHNCNLNCPGCYVNKNKGYELNYETVRKLLNTLSQMKVFRIDIGGGEPLLYPKLFQVLKECRRKNLGVAITTNGTLLTNKICQQFNPLGVRRVQVSLDAHTKELYHRIRGIDCFERVIAGTKFLSKNQVPFGINCIVVKKNLTHLQEIIELSLKKGAQEVKLLRSKPAVNKEWYLKHKLDKQETYYLQKLLSGFKRKYSDKVRLDTAFCFLYKDNLPQKLKEDGQFGCLAADRSCAIDADGNVYPCPFFKLPEFVAGSILTDNLKDIWVQSKILNKFRNWKYNLQGDCGVCDKNEICFGCRRIALEEYGNVKAVDPSCQFI